jgi:RNA polymerase primary sigma factor
LAHPVGPDPAPGRGSRKATAAGARTRVDAAAPTTPAARRSRKPKLGSTEPARRRKLKHTDIAGAEEEELLRRCRTGDRAAEGKIIEAHESLVWFVARRIVGQRGVTDDLLQHGRMGLLAAVRRFDPNFHAKLATYAPHWNRHHITRATHDEGTTIRVPTHMHEKIQSHRKYVHEELPAKLGDARRLMSDISLETPVRLGNDFVSTVGDAIADDGPSQEEALGEAADRAASKAMVDAALLCLTPQERDVIRRRHLSGSQKII